MLGSCKVGSHSLGEGQLGVRRDRDAAPGGGEVWWKPGWAVGFLTHPQGCARAWAEPPPSLWTAANVPQHPAGSCFSRDCRTLIGFSARVPGAGTPERNPSLENRRGRGRWGGVAMGGAGAASLGSPPLPARGGTLEAFRPIAFPDVRRAGPSRLSVLVGLLGWAGLAGRRRGGSSKGRRWRWANRRCSLRSLPRRLAVEGQWSCPEPSRVQSGSPSEAPVWRWCGVRSRLALQVRGISHCNAQLAGRGASSLIFPDLSSSPAPSCPWVGGRSFWTFSLLSASVSA